MKKRTFKIKSFDDIIKIGTTFGKNWYRGHSKRINDELKPAIFRSQYWNEISKIFDKEPELRFYSEFIRKSYTYFEKLPEYDDYLEWLFLMQHYGLPTRLLDWTENILIATYFAVIYDLNEDGEIWSINPEWLNSKIAVKGMPLPNNEYLIFMSEEPFLEDTALSIRNPNNMHKIPMAILPTIKFLRLRVQQGCFTIHRPPELGTSLESVLTEENMLSLFIIPKNLKSTFKVKLQALGIHKSTLYPDLDGLAQSIKEINSVFWTGTSKISDLKLDKYSPDDSIEEKA